MTSWLAPALTSLMIFGFWGLFAKLSLFYIDSKSALVYQSIGALLAGLFALVLVQFKPEYEIRGLTFGILTGLCSGLGGLFFLFAVTKGKSSTVVTLTSLYPVVTIMLSFIILREGLQAKQILGVIFALVALHLLS
jgi:transporter family protein